MAEETKGRRISKRDWNRVEEFVNDIYSERKDSTFRKEHEEKWKEVDRQIKMNPLKRMSEKGRELPPDWHNVLELGELSKASEIITSDVMRIALPNDKSWFQPHVNLKWPTDPQTGKPKTNGDTQKIADGLLRSLMVQQHNDFGFKARFRLSVKEALHHGSFSSEVRFEDELMVKSEGRIRIVGAPVWMPYSMWNTYPDPSPSVIGTNMFYTGSMIFVDYMPLWKLKQIASGTGWMQDNVAKVEKEEHQTEAGKTEEVELVKFYGDVSIDRQDGDILLPNSKVILANGKIVFWDTNELPFPPVIYNGYERQDIRDPYYTSPIIKQSPTQKAASISLNHFLNASALKVEPPIEYDGNDPDYVANDGPSIAPGAKTPTKSMGKGMQALDIGDPAWGLKSVELFMRQMQEGTGVSALRSGTTNSDRQTAFEVNKVSQGAEVRTIEFIANLEPAMRTFLYMQHELNRMKMKEYEFYNDEMHTPDVIRVTKDQIQANAYFEVTGTRGLLGEEQRVEKKTQVTAFASGNPLFAPILKPRELLLSMYRDAGEKNPEDYVQIGDQQSPQDAALKMQLQQMQQLLQKFAKENEDLKKAHDIKIAQLQQDGQQFAVEVRKEQAQFTANLAEQKREFEKDWALRAAELKAQLSKDWIESMSQIHAGGEVGKVVKQLQDLSGKQSDALLKASEAIDGVSKKVTEIDAAQKKGKRKVGKIKAPSGKEYSVDIQETP